jgi:RNA 3'-terminal phosphate cyclase (ATP)
MDILEIDGSYGEGGGQILRSALALSLITGQPFRLVNIRARRDQPGLRPQHLTSVASAATISNAEISGAQVNSLTLEFAPRPVQAGTFQFEVGTAGAITLVLQTLLLPLCWASETSHLVLGGGTHVPWSPSFHYISDVFLPMVARMGVQARVELHRAGWYPRGGGEIAAMIMPVDRQGLRSLNLTERGALRQITVYALLSNLPDHIAHRESRRATHLLRELLEVQPQLEILNLPSMEQGTMVVLVAEFQQTIAGFSAMGKVGKRAEEVAEEAVQHFLAFYSSDATVDSHLTDQLLLYMALAQGRSCIVTPQLTEHVRSNIWLIEQFLPIKFEVQGEFNQQAIIAVAGQ